MILPVDPLVAEHQAALEGAKSELTQAKLAVTMSNDSCVKGTARFNSLSAAASIPTPEAVLAAREIRDSAIAEVRTRLGRPRATGDEDAGAALSLAVERADVIVDRRDAEADRVAEHLLSRTSLSEAEAPPKSMLSWRPWVRFSSFRPMPRRA
jgi:hypothetical protein